MTHVVSATSIAQAWVTATEYLGKLPDHTTFNLILDVTDPTVISAKDEAVISKVDAFLVAHDVGGISTVANTIFPTGVYNRHGRAGIFEMFPKKLYPKAKKNKSNSWGTYAYRMVRRVNDKGVEINPLENIIRKLRREGKANNSIKSHYELNLVDVFLDIPIADPALTGTNNRLGGPCLSHISFKLTGQKEVSLTAFYRSHHYMERALGNLVGLTRLLEFVSKESSLAPGSLTCISSYARLDQKTWGFTEANTLVGECKALLA